MNQREYTNNEKIKGSKIPRLKHMTKFMFYIPFISSTQNNIFSQGDTSRKAFSIKESYGSQLMLYFPCNKKQKKQPHKILWELPYIKKDCEEKPHSRLFLAMYLIATYDRAIPAAKDTRA